MRLRLLIGAALAGAAILWAAGFLGFVDELPRQRPAAEIAPADAIVVLTGGRGARIAYAGTLLGADKAARLLITGVHREIGDDQVRALAGAAAAARFACCVDIDRSAENTARNAEEIAAWARAGGYDSLIIVTSDFHMPRALLEIEAHAPRLALIPAPVASEAALNGGWRRNPATLRLLASEYVKYLIVSAKY